MTRARDAAGALLRWYSRNYARRSLPWRNHGEPIDRVSMVEGLLAQTRADAVAAAYHEIFRGVRTFADWLALEECERLSRVSPLGLAAQKESAVTGIATVMSRYNEGDVPESIFEELCSMHSVGPYTAGMVLILRGLSAAPVDCNVNRVVGRMGSAIREKFEIDDIMKHAEVMRSQTGYPPQYEVLCAVLDVGARICLPHLRDCNRCPVRFECSTNDTLGAQELLPFDQDHSEARYETARVFDSPEVDIGVDITDVGVHGNALNMEALAEDIESMSDLFYGKTKNRVGRLVIGYLRSQYPDRKIWCKVSGDGGLVVTYWA